MNTTRLIGAFFSWAPYATHQAEIEKLRRPLIYCFVPPWFKPSDRWQWPINGCLFTGNRLLNSRQFVTRRVATWADTDLKLRLMLLLLLVRNCGDICRPRLELLTKVAVVDDCAVANHDGWICVHTPRYQQQQEQHRVSRWCSDRASGVWLVIERSRVRLPAVALPGSLGQLSLSSLRGR